MAGRVMRAQPEKKAPPAGQSECDLDPAPTHSPTEANGKVPTTATCPAYTLIDGFKRLLRSKLVTCLWEVGWGLINSRWCLPASMNVFLWADYNADTSPKSGRHEQTSMRLDPVALCSLGHCAVLSPSNHDDLSLLTSAHHSPILGPPSTGEFLGYFLIILQAPGFTPSSSLLGFSPESKWEGSGAAGNKRYTSIKQQVQQNDRSCDL